MTPIWRIMAWLLGFMVFAAIGYVYHWWSSDAQSDIQGFVSLGSIARVSRSVFEMMLMTLVVMLGLTKVFATRVQLQTAIRTYGVYLWLVFNPPILLIVAWLLPGLGEAFVVIVVPVVIVLIFELIIAWYWIRPTFKKIGTVIMTLLALPSVFWGLWSGFLAWSYRPAIAITCQNSPYLQGTPEDFIQPNFNKWANRLEPVPKADSLPSIDVVNHLTIPVVNELFNVCQNKQAFSFQAAHYNFWFELRFLSTDHYLYKAQIQAVQFEKSPLQFLGSWQSQKIRQTKPRIIIKNPEMIIQHLEKIYKIIPELRKSPCTAFVHQYNPKTRAVISTLVADMGELGQAKKLYRISANKLERTWTALEIVLSMQRIATRLGFGKITEFTWDTENQGLGLCSLEKPYLGYQLFSERFFARIPSIGVIANAKRFDVDLNFTKYPAQLTVWRSQEPQIQSYEFLPSNDDVPWTRVDTLEAIKYTATPLLPTQKSK